MTEARLLLICTDGSPGSDRAVEAAGRFFPGATALVAHAWQPPLPIAAMRGGVAFQVAEEVQSDLEEQARGNAEAVAERSAGLAREAGLDARPLVIEATGAVWSELLSAADEHDADLIVAGSKGWGEIRSLLLGSTSAGLVHHSARPVLVVPTREES